MRFSQAIGGNIFALAQVHLVHPLKQIYCLSLVHRPKGILLVLNWKIKCPIQVVLLSMPEPIFDRLLDDGFTPSELSLPPNNVL